DAPVLVVVVDECATQERLQRLVHRGQRDPLLERLVAVYLGEVLRRAGQERREEERKLRTLARRGQELLRVLGQEGGLGAGAVLQHERHTARGADARDGGRGKREHLRLGHA